MIERSERTLSVAPYIPPGHPVRRFVSVLVGIAAALAVSWALGIGAPRADTSKLQDAYDPTTGVGRAVVEVHNAGLLDVEIVAVRDVGAIAFADVDPAVVPGGETARVDIVYQLQCPDLGSIAAARFVLESPTGLRQEDDVQLGGVFCPAE